MIISRYLFIARCRIFIIKTNIEFSINLPISNYILIFNAINVYSNKIDCVVIEYDVASHYIVLSIM